MVRHFCEVSDDNSDFATRPGWKVRCHFCRTWYYTDIQDESGVVDAEAAQSYHEETGTWP